MRDWPACLGREVCRSRNGVLPKTFTTCTMGVRVPNLGSLWLTYVLTTFSVPRGSFLYYSSIWSFHPALMLILTRREIISGNFPRHAYLSISRSLPSLKHSGQTHPNLFGHTYLSWTPYVNILGNRAQLDNLTSTPCQSARCVPPKCLILMPLARMLGVCCRDT